LKTQAHLDAARKRYGKGYKSRMARKSIPRGRCRKGIDPPVKNTSRIYAVY